jgi:dihydroorotate dehydrogenase
MPDWSYRTFIRPTLLRLAPETARSFCIGVLSRIGKHSVGRSAIDFLGHMRADARLSKTIAGHSFPGPIGIGSLLDPQAKALNAFSGFGCGFLVVGPVGPETVAASDWEIDLQNGRVLHRGPKPVLGFADAAARISAPGRADVPVFAELDSVTSQSIKALAPLIAGFIVKPEDIALFNQQREGFRGLLLALAKPNSELPSSENVDGLWLSGPFDTDEPIRLARKAIEEKVLVCGPASSPLEADSFLANGADLVFIDAGLAISGPGLVKRTNEALLSHLPKPATPALSLESARESWFWGLMLGMAMLVGGIIATILASSRVVLPYDEALCGIPRGAFASINPRLLPFMAHDRMTLAGSMLSLAILYIAVAWNGIRLGHHWAKSTLILSSGTGFFSFFLFLGYGYFDPFHAFITAVLVQFVFFTMATPLGPAHPPAAADWQETPAWRRAQWGQLLFIGLGVGLVVAGLVISYVGCTTVFVATDLEFLQIAAAKALVGTDRLIPLIAHDRASLDGMLISNGLFVWLSAQWGMRAGARWLWLALAWAGNVAFAIAIGVHIVVGYTSWVHLAPAFAGWATWLLALGLTKGWLCGNAGKNGAGNKNKVISQ